MLGSSSGVSVFERVRWATQSPPDAKRAGVLCSPPSVGAPAPVVSAAVAASEDNDCCRRRFLSGEPSST